MSGTARTDRNSTSAGEQHHSVHRKAKSAEAIRAHLSVHNPNGDKPTICPKRPSRQTYVTMIHEEAALWDMDAGRVLNVHGRPRLRRHALVRFRVFRRLLKLGYGLSAIGKTAGVDHTTVYYGKMSNAAREEQILTKWRDRNLPKPEKPKATHIWGRDKSGRFVERLAGANVNVRASRSQLITHRFLVESP